MKAIDLMMAAHRKRQADYAKAEADKRGTYRGGNSGAVMADGSPTGACPRLIHLRVNHGFQEQEDTTLANGLDTKLVMFDGGFANEWSWDDNLKQVMPDTHVLMAEDELGLAVTLPNGLPFSGRPDHVFARKTTKNKTSWLHSSRISMNDTPVVPEHVLEHKGVFSIWTARNVRFLNKPKLNNIIQCARYMWELGNLNQKSGHQVRPTGELLYTNYSLHVVNSLAARCLPSYGQAGYTYMNWFFYTCHQSNRAKKGWGQKDCDEATFLQMRDETFIVGQGQDEGKRQPMAIAMANNVKPFIAGFDVEWKAVGEALPSIHWKPSESEKWTDTSITIVDMDRLYEQAEEMKDPSSQLPPMPINLTASMVEDKNSACHYCSLKNMCKEPTVKTVKDFEEKTKEFFSLDKFPSET